MYRISPVALFASVSLAALIYSTDGFARGGGHFGGGHFGGGHFGGGREFRERDFRPERREEMRRPERREDHRDEARREDHDRDHARDHDHDHDRDHAQDGEHDHDRDHDHDHDHDHAERHDGDHRDFANRDLNRPANVGHWDHNAFWNDRFGGHGWVCNNCRWGWAGGVFWPFALGDVFSFAWWPYGGPPAFWNYGLNYIETGLFWPYGAYQWPDGYGAYLWPGSSGGNEGYKVARETHQNVYSGGPAAGSDVQATQSQTPDDLTLSCSGYGPGVSVLPISQIETTVQPKDDQQAAFNELKTASAKAEAILKGACPSEPALTPVGRLDALQKRLQAMDQAVDTVKGPLVGFTYALDPAQKKALDGMVPKGSSGSDMEMGDLGRCIDEGQEFVGLPAQEIAQSVQPNAKQNAALDKLEAVSNDAAERLRSQCPTKVPPTVAARLDAMDQRLHETITAVNDVRPALVDFYESLSDEQKARFNTLPPEPQAKSP